MNTAVPTKTRNALLPLAFALAIRTVLGLYWIARYGGHWIEDDTSRVTACILGVLKSGRLVPTYSRVYANGFLYPAYGAFVSLIAGVQVTTFQAWMSLPVALALTILAFVFYRRLLGDPIAAGAAALMLNLQGDFLFTSSRGTHEKMVFMLVFTSLLAMALAISRVESWRWRLALASVYYLTMFALSTTNVFFGSTFAITLLLAFLIASVLARRILSGRQHSRWLIYLAAASLIFIYLVMFVLYSPARLMIVTAQDLSERQRLLFLSFSETPAIYQAVSQDWIFPQAWLVLRAFDMFLIVAAAIGWLILIRPAHRQDSPRIVPAPSGRFWLLTLFPAFAVQNVLAAINDFTGSAMEIKNLQVRLVPLTVFAAAPLAAYAVLRIFARLRIQQRQRRLAVIVMAGAMILFGMMALVKSTSEPLLANTWMFYTVPESAGVGWLDQHALLLDSDLGRHSPQVWAGPSFRLGQVWLNEYWGEARHFVPVTSDLNEPHTIVVLSPTIRMEMARLQQPLPDVRSLLRVYDGGQVQIYHTWTEDSYP
jgi:hypothetical protein